SAWPGCWVGRKSTSGPNSRRRSSSFLRARPLAADGLKMMQLVTFVPKTQAGEASQNTTESSTNLAIVWHIFLDNPSPSVILRQRITRDLKHGKCCLPRSADHR